MARSNGNASAWEFRYGYVVEMIGTKEQCLGHVKGFRDIYTRRQKEVFILVQWGDGEISHHSPDELYLFKD